MSLSGIPILDNYGSWSEPKLPLLRVDTPTLIQVPYLGPMGPGFSLSHSAHTHYQILLSRVNELGKKKKLKKLAVLTHRDVPVSC